MKDLKLTARGELVALIGGALVVACVCYVALVAAVVMFG